MARTSLLEYFQRDSRPSDEIVVVWRSGYRTIRWSYEELFRAANRFAWELSARGIQKGDRVLLWAENSGWWMATFLGCMFSGAVCVPMDLAADKGFEERVAGLAGVRLSVLGKGLALSGSASQTLQIEDFFESEKNGRQEMFPSPSITGSEPVQIVFTSGTTAEPRGVVLTHSNILANIQPIEQEFGRYRRYERFLHPAKDISIYFR